MDERLSVLAAMVPQCRVAADVGADHGKLGVHLLQSGKCETVYLTDVSAPSLEKARRLVQREGLEARCLIRVGDGLDPLPEFDAAVIAGMGGATIMGILQRGMDKIGQARLILEPNVGAADLRRFLAENGFAISDEAVTRAGGRWYVCIRAEKGSMTLTEAEALAGPVLLKRKDKGLAGYKEFRVRVAQKALQGAEKADPVSAEALKNELRIWEEIGHALSEN